MISEKSAVRLDMQQGSDKRLQPRLTRSYFHLTKFRHSRYQHRRIHIQHAKDTHLFSDGVGTMSQGMLDRIWKATITDDKQSGRWYTKCAWVDRRAFYLSILHYKVLRSVYVHP